MGHSKLVQICRYRVTIKSEAHKRNKNHMNACGSSLTIHRKCTDNCLGFISVEELPCSPPGAAMR